MSMRDVPPRPASGGAPTTALTAARGGPPRSRREFLRVGAAALAAGATAACPSPRVEGEPTMNAAPESTRAADGRIAARPGAGKPAGDPPAGDPPAPGLHRLGLAAGRDALLYVPAAYQADRPAPLAVMLHGAGGTAEHGLSLLRAEADAAGLLLLAPPSRRQTWDVLLGGYGPDVTFVDRALAAAFARCAVDAGRVAVGGFSDGGSYALSLGLTNGDLFTHVIALSPGFMAPASLVGKPRCFVSHGTRDAVLPIDRCSRRLVPELRRAGYDVRYDEFDGPHTVPGAIARAAAAWFTA
jgi:phospholipase/carboxylesterase